MSRSREEVLALYEQYRRNGSSLVQIGARAGISHEAVRQLFIQHGLRLPSASERAAARHQTQQQRVEANAAQIIDLYKEHGEISEVMARLDLDPLPPRKLVAEVIARIPNREAYRRRGKLPGRSEAELIADLQSAAKSYGEPLTATKYRDAAKAFGLAAYNTQVRAFGSFAEALARAGIQGNPMRGRYAHSFTESECVNAVVRCIIDHRGRRVSYEEYRDWAADIEGVPSGPTIRNVTGWNSAVEQALDILGHGVR